MVGAWEGVADVVWLVVRTHRERANWEPQNGCRGAPAQAGTIRHANRYCAHARALLYRRLSHQQSSQPPKIDLVITFLRAAGDGHYWA